MQQEWIEAGVVHIEGGAMLLNDLPETETDHYLAGYGEAILAGDIKRWPGANGYLPSSDDLGVILCGFGGDGSFRVYVRKDEDGLITEARIIFREGTPRPQAESPVSHGMRGSHVRPRQHRTAGGGGPVELRGSASS